MVVALGGFLSLSTIDVLANPGYGSITGNVYEEATGNPLYPATIRIENHDTGELVGEFSNYPDGTFHIVVEEGSYRLGASASGYVTAWYPNNGTREDATSITVVSGDFVYDINFSLQPGGSISGMVYNQWWGTEQNQVVIAWTADTLEFVAWTFSASQYTIIDLPYGDYKVSAGGPLPEGVEDPGNRQQNLIRGWWSQEGTVASADAAGVITIDNPTPIENIDFQLKEGGQLEGRVTDEDGNGLNGATVTLEDYDTGEVLATTTSYVRGEWDQGYFLFSGLSSDIDYRVWVTATDRVIRYSREHTSGTYDRDNATRHQVEQGKNLWISDIYLPYGGSLSGYVYQSDGTTPIAGATVVVESWDDGGGDWVRVEETTSTDGSYTVPGIPLGNYLVFALASGFTIEHYAAAGSVAAPDQAEEVILSPGQIDVTGIDFSLDAGGTISGTVSNESGQLLEGAEVYAVPAIEGSEGYDEGPKSPFAAMTNSSGEYTIVGLPFDNYKVYAHGGDNPQYVSEWYDNQSSYETASTISVSAESSDWVVIAFNLAIGGSITGIVMPDGGDPWLNDARITVFDYNTGTKITEAGTLEDNMTYLIQGIPTGSYLVIAEAQDRALKFWQDTYNEAEATPVQVTAPGVTLNINFNLSPGGKMNGRVWMSGEYGGHEILPDALVTAYLLNPIDTPDEDFEDMEFTTNTDDNGDWELEHLPYGDYKIGASGGEEQMVIPKWWSDYGEAYSWDDAGVVTLDYNWGWWTEFWLNPAGLVTGFVYGEDGATPITNAEVFGLQIRGTSYDGTKDEESNIIATTTTDTDGSYELFCPTDQGSFIVGAQADGSVRMFFQNTFAPSEAIEFLLEVGEEVGGVNFSLEPAGTISGTVSDASTSEGLTGCVVLAIDESTGVDFKTSVNEDGTYTIDNLPFGEYIVMSKGMQDDPLTSNYAMEWWQETASYEGATPVVVDATTADVTEINFTLEPGSAIEGMVRHEHGWDINGALVTLYLPDGTQLANAWSNGWEGYNFNGVPSGEYKISAWYVEPQGGSNTQHRFYNDQTSLETADTVIVTAPDTVSGIDFTLPQANGQISGLVMYTGSLQASDYEQVVVIARPYEVDVPPQMLYQTSINSPGSYQMYNIADGGYIIIAFLDIDGDYEPDPGEPYGFYGDPTPVTLASTVENPYPQAPGTSIVITDEAHGIIMGNVSLEGVDDHSGATVTTGSYQTTTTQDGAYILNVAPGTYSVTIDKAGYLAAVSSEIYVVEILSGEPVEMPDALLLRGDIDDSGVIDVADLISATDNLGTVGPTGDLNEDGIVDVLDLVPVGRNFGMTESLWLEDGESATELPPASGTPSFVLEPSSQSLAPGETVTVNAVIEDVSGLYAAEFHLSFDSTLLEVQDSDATIFCMEIAPSPELFPFATGAYYSAEGENLYYYSYSANDGGYFIAPQCQADNDLEEINYVIVLLSPEGEAYATPVSASADGAVVATITFNSLDEGEASIDFTTSPKLADAAGDSIAVDSFTGTTLTIEIPPPELSNITTSNVGNLSFTVSWITNVATTGQINYGTSPDSLSNIAYDERGQAAEDDTHHVTITGLAANTPYYFDVISAETTDDNDGAHYEITTGPGLDFKMPDPITGTVYKLDGITAAEGTIVYVSIGTSQVLSTLVDSSGNWGMDIAPIRTADYQSYYAYADSDSINVEAQGSADGTASQAVTVATARTGAPAMTLVPNYAPTVENVTASQDTGTGTVSIEYDVYDQDEDDTSVEVSFAYWNGTTYVDSTTVTGDGTKTVTTTSTHYTATWDAKTDFDGQYITDAKIKVITDDGNILGAGEGISNEFTLDTEGPTGIAGSSPNNEATDVDLSPTLTAVEATDPSTPVSYYFTIARDQSFETGVQESGWLSEDTWAPSTRLQAPEVSYWWKVKAKDSFGNISESTAFKLTTLAVVPVDVGLVDGWNIIALAVEPVGGYTASTLAAAINEQGGDVIQVFWWNAAAGSWDFYLADIGFGTDFNIEVGYGYLLKNTTPATWTYLGVPLSAEYSVTTVEPQVTNVGNMSFTISWVSQDAEQGSVNYGASASSLDNTTYDERGQTTEDDTHHVTITGLTASTPYYYEIVSGGATYNNGGVPYEITTGPGLDFKMPDPITGTAYKTGGVTAAEGTIIYVSIGTSQVLSTLVDSSGAWGLDIAAIRAADYQSYYTYSDSDNITVEAQGAADGLATQTVTVTIAKAGAPAMEVSIAAEVSLVNGWNLIALPVEPATSYTASTMAAEINSQNGNVIQVFWWNAAAGSWDFYLADMGFGTDFNIELGEGYLLKSTTASTWAVPSS